MKKGERREEKNEQEREREIHSLTHLTPFLSEYTIHECLKSPASAGALCKQKDGKIPDKPLKASLPGL